MNIEYPDYLTMTSQSEPNKYLEGDTVSFRCGQTHWFKGTQSFRCTRMRGSNGSVVKWSSGSQPWCRSKRLGHSTCNRRGSFRQRFLCIMENFKRVYGSIKRMYLCFKRVYGLSRWAAVSGFARRSAVGQLSTRALTAHPPNWILTNLETPRRTKPAVLIEP